MTYCLSGDLIPLGKGYFYLEKDNKIYLKGKGQRYKPIKKLKNIPKIKITNKEFNHRAVDMTKELKNIIQSKKVN